MHPDTITVKASKALYHRLKALAILHDVLVEEYLYDLAWNHTEQALKALDATIQPHGGEDIHPIARQPFRSSLDTP